ncbi:protein kinase [Exophiala xenobiotica]|nr:protein kinase [Exophiala xenobiotica]KAK5373600.1 protein kinase [Exophiala xenobiotica]KAK5402280.1 protein kinase [Exophiala xenobiotica]KAK5419299.1 protein kinase [Exophiala xenobiotica]KAK5466787.1 protein kinase [Exophiala xenobiotica]
MADDLINFDIIESHKENIQALPGGRSAKQLAAILTPLPSGRVGAKSEPTLNETKTLNDAIRQEYEIELQSIADSDDPLDIYDRYVRWTLNAYPSAQATPQSQLLPLLERATKAFLTSSHYKNDPRYLKLWLHYIRLFSDSPRETFAFLARHSIGDGLGLFYEEFAAWLEGAGRWVQADEVYKLGIEREARPTERLIRKYNQFQHRFEARPQVENEPSSPALPTVRPALAAKLDPFAPSQRDEQQAPRQQNGAGGGSTNTSRSGKPKMAIFSDADSAGPPPSTSTTTNGWDSIGSIRERKKENTIEAKPWAGEKMKAGTRVGTVQKMEIFKDPALEAATDARPSTKRPGDVVNPRTGRTERVFVDVEAIYPSIDQEFSFEELRALARGWSQTNWRQQRLPATASPLKDTTGNVTTSPKARGGANKAQELEDVENLSRSFQQKIDLNNNTQGNLSILDVSSQSMVGIPEPQPACQTQPQSQNPREKKYKIREVKQETQTVKTRLESPTGRKLKRKNTTEPTMTFHSKAATNEIYDMFNQPLRKPEVARDDTQSGDETDFTEGEIDDGYSTTGDAESTGTGRVSGPSSEFGDDTLASRFDHTESQTQTQSQSQPESISPWSDFTASRHVPRIDSHIAPPSKTKASSGKGHARTKLKNKHRHALSEDVTESIDSSSQNATQTSGLGGGYDTQAIAAIANCNFDDMDTMAIARIAGEVDEEEQDDVEIRDEQTASSQGAGAPDEPEPQQRQTMHGEDDMESLSTPVDDVFTEHMEISHKPRFVPIPPADYEPTPVRTYRDPALVAQNKMPFMTPIVERTESSVAPSTVFNDPDYFSSKTPSRSAKEIYESPSQVKIDRLLMSSPQQQEPGTPSSSAKRKFEQTGATEEEVVTSSPRQKVLGRGQADLNSHIPFPITKGTPAQSPSKADDIVFKTPAIPVKSPARSVLQPTTRHKAPIIADLQCNPCDDTIRQQILTAVHPPISSYAGFHDHSEQALRQYPVLKSYAEKIAKAKSKPSPRKSQSKDAATKAVPPLLKFTGTSRVYAVKRELGEGAFAPVYLVESYDPGQNAIAVADGEDDSNHNDKENVSPQPASSESGRRQHLEALKTESPPGTLVWEFHILRLVRQRLGHAARSMQSIVLAHECHLYRDEAYIVLDYSPQGTLLDLVNLARSDSVRAGKPAEGLDEVLAMWFSVELLRTLEDLHRIGVLHGDLKGDNCLVRFGDGEVEGSYDPSGGRGWAAKGLRLIDFGRGIDTKMFKAGAQFIADWPSAATDCAEIRECRPWKWQIDYHGAAGVIHSLLFGKYIETIPAGHSSGGLGSAGPGQKKEWKLKENLKRYWEKEIWADVFNVLLNPGCVADGEEMPVQGNLKRVRVRMEKWLVDEGERGGRDLRTALRKMERLVGGK